MLISVKNTSVLRKQKKTVVFLIVISKETRTCTQHPYISTENQRQRSNFCDAAEAGAPAFAAVPTGTQAQSKKTPVLGAILKTARFFDTNQHKKSVMCILRPYRNSDYCRQRYDFCDAAEADARDSAAVAAGTYL